MLTCEEKKRYSRHLLLEEIGEAGQEKIKEARVLVIGAGGLGSPVLFYLAAAGVGTIGLMDDDVVSESNLQRQILYDSTCINELKVNIAVRKLQMLNPSCNLHPYPYRLTAENASEILGKYDIVVDATDNLPARYVIDDACIQCGKPFVYGSICEFEGQVSVFNYQGGPSYRDLFEYHDGIRDFKQPLGVIGALPGVIGSLEAAETIKIILGKATLSGKIMLVNLLTSTFQTLELGI